MDNNDSQSDQPPSADSPKPAGQPEEKREPVRFKIWQLEWSGPLPPLLALVFGLGIGVVLLYLSIFEFQRPKKVYDFLMATPFAEAISEWQTLNPPPTQPEEIVKTVVVTEVVEVVATEVVEVEVVATEVVEVEVEVTRIVEVTPTSTPLPKSHEIFASDLRDAFGSAGTVIKDMGVKYYRSSFDKENLIEDIMKPKLNNTWILNAEKRMTEVLFTIIRSFPEIESVIWNVDVPKNLDSFKDESNSTNDKVIYIIPDVKSYLEITGQINCRNGKKQIYGDTNPIVFVSDLTVDLLIDENTYVITKWIPEDVQWPNNEDAIINYLEQYCLSSTPTPP
jgi:hypothetical protein